MNKNKVNRIVNIMNLINSIRGGGYYTDWKAEDLKRIIKFKETGQTGGFSFELTNKMLFIIPDRLSLKKEYLKEE